MENVLQINKTYVYRKHLRGSLFNYLMVVLGFVIMINIMGISVVVAKDRTINAEMFLIFGVVSLFLGIVLLIEVLIFYFAMFRRFKKVSVTLTDNGIVYKNIKGVVTVPYEDIEKIAFPSVKYTGGWVKIVYKGGNIRLTVVLEHIGEFIYELKKILDEKEKSTVYNDKKIFSFIKTASFSDESWERFYSFCKFGLFTLIATFILSLLIVFASNKVIGSGSIIFGPIFAPLVGYLIYEIICGFKVKKRVVEGAYKVIPRDVENENKMIKAFTVSTAVIYLLGLSIFILIP